MNRAKKLLRRVAGTLDLPADVIAGLPKMELTGDAEFSMEPHKGLLAYEDRQIIVDSSLGPVQILGRDLSIKRMNQARITIMGTIDAVTLQDGDRHE